MTTGPAAHHGRPTKKKEATMTTGIVLSLTFSNRIEYDNPDHGAGYRQDGTEDGSTWSPDMSYANATIHAKDCADIEQTLAEHLAAHYLPPLADWWVFEPGRLTTNRDEDGDGNPVDDSWHRAGHQMHLVDYDINIKVLPDETTPTELELHALFPSVPSYDGLWQLPNDTEAASA
jgi:hypothetical protein